MKKFLLRFTSLLLVASFFTGCVSPETEDANNTTEAEDAEEMKTEETNAEETAAADTTEQETVVIAVNSDLKTLDPSIAYEVFSNFYFYATYDNLIKLEGSDISNPKPCLATEYSVDETGKVWTFKLREGVKFSSGNDFTSKDVAFSFNRTKNIKGNASHHAANIEKVETPDDYTAVVTLIEPDASFEAKLSQCSLAIIDSELAKANGATDAEDASTTDTATEFFNNNSVGSGAYVLSSWVPKTELVLEKNPNYWGTEPFYDRVIIKEVPDANVEMQMLQSGEVDVAFSVGPDQLKAAEGNPDIQIINSPTATISFLLMNQDETIGGPVADPKVQQAIRYAIDYEGFKALAGEGSSTPVSFVPMGFPGAKTKPEDYRDVEKAKALMAEAGYPDGFSITLTTGNFDTNGMQWTTMAQKLQADLKEIGIDVTIETQEIGVVLDAYRQGQVPFMLMHWSPDYFDINNQLAFAPGDIVGLRANWQAEDAPEMAELAKQIMVEVDETKRVAEVEQLQDMMGENSPYAFILQHPVSFAASSEIDVTYNDLCKIQISELKPVQ